MTYVLKHYQTQSLAALRQYLSACAQANANPANVFAQMTGVPTYHARFGEQVPCVCLRVPTGGGKTLMAAHAVSIAGRALLHTDAPVALWLTPSDTIRKQTLEAFQDPRHPYRLALSAQFGDNVRVCDLESLQTVGPHDVGHSAIVVITTIQSLSVRKTTDRNVYSFFEALSPHFESLSPQARQGLEVVTLEDLANQPYLTPADVGRVKHSVANWLHLQRPVVIVDEAHNNQTKVFYNAIGRINPACVLEFTATPVPGINVLHHVSAQELKAEQMVKLPIVLTEHPKGWQECLHDARRKRDQLELLAQKESDYLRPIALIQAEDKNGTATVEVVKQYLVQDEQIPPNQIAVVTGSQKELDGINLFEPDCSVRYVITVEALKEGWDCSFAYVLASLQSVRSAKDVEQLLGRVLRMPYARNREQEALNRAYAHIVAESFAEAAHNITDRMVQNMGYNPFEAAALFAHEQGSLALDATQAAKAPAPWPSFQVNLSAMPSEADMAQWPVPVRDAVQVRPTSQGATLLMPGNLSDATLAQVQQCVSAPLPAAEQAQVHQQFEVQRTLREAQCAPATLGVQFAPLPQLCLPLEGHLEVVDRLALSSMGHLDLLDEPVQLAQFDIRDTSQTFEIDLQEQGSVQYQYVDAKQSALELVHTDTLSEADLVRWLDRDVRQPDVSQPHMQKWLLKMVAHLRHERHFDLNALVRARFALVPALLNEVDRLRERAASKGFQQSLPHMTTADPQQQPHCVFRFDASAYLLNRPSLTQWLQSDEGCAQFRFGQAGSHTFAYDVFQALAGLYPKRPGRRQLWQDLSDENLTMNALLLTVQSDPGQIGRDTLERFERAMLELKRFAQLAFQRLRMTRAAREHPFEMNFLHRVLLAMPNTQRDLFWTEWIRENSVEIENDLKLLSDRWTSGTLDEREIQRARWVMWTLTSTSKSLRDLATKTLYEFAIKRPAEFFQLAIDAIAIADPYVPERMFAAAYGAALTTWSDLNAVEMREALPKVAQEIYKGMFAPGAPHHTWHALYRQYCLGIIAIAQMIEPTCLSEDEAAHLLPPFSHLPDPFSNIPYISVDVIERAKRGAIRMDFGNYTMGRLIPGRMNYDDSNQEYQQVLSAIVSRMLVLGYDHQQFEAVDRQMNSGPRMGADKHKVDRYGKKYGWIAYFEMWGVRHAQGLLDERRDTRPSDADIDPTFPLKAPVVELPLPDVFSSQPTEIGDWIMKGPQPDYGGILEISEVDGFRGSWVLLDGYLEQTATDNRQVFTFLRGVLVDSRDVENLCALFASLEYPGNSAIPDAPEHYYTYAGEMPFFSMPGLPSSNDHEDDSYEQMVSADRWAGNGVRVDIPVQHYNWESYHSVMNQSGSAVLPSKQICEGLNLRYRANKWDLHDASGVASLYRKVGADDSQVNGWFSYLRQDLLDNYLKQSGKTLLWLMWGERGLHYRSPAVQNGQLHDYYADHQHIHKRFQVYENASSI